MKEVSQLGDLHELICDWFDLCTAGFITQWLRRVRARLCPNKVEEDPELELAIRQQSELELAVRQQSVLEKTEEKEEKVEVKEYDPEEAIDAEPPLTGMARFNLIKRIKRRRRLSKGSGVESGSVLQKKLTKLALYIVYAGTAAAVLCILVLVLKFSITEFGIVGRSWDNSLDLPQLLHFVFIGISVFVLAVPEGLLLAVPLSISWNIRKMLKDNILIRSIHACEAIGNATSICVNKTGVLTTNQMAVVESYFAGNKYDVIPKLADLPDNLIEALKLDISINSSYTSKLEADVECSLARQVGNITECALLCFLKELGEAQN